MSNAAMTVDQTVDRLIADPNYRIAVAVANNYAAALKGYQGLQLATDRPSVGALTMRLQKLRSSGFEPEVDNMLAAVPWLPGNNEVLDAAYLRLQEEADSPDGQEALGKASDDNNSNNDSGAGWLLGGIGMGISGLAQIVGMIGAGGRAREAAEAEQERLYLLGQLQSEQDAARTARTKLILKAAGIGAAVLVAILLVVYFIRKRNGA